MKQAHVRSRWWALLAVIALLAASCGDDDTGGTAEPTSCEPGETDGDLAFYNWSEYIDPELVKTFETEAGISVSQDFFPSNEELFAKVESGNSGFDVIVPSDYMVDIMIQEDLLLPLDKGALTNLGNLAPEFSSGLPFDPEGDYSVPYQWGTTGIGVDLAVVGDDVAHTWGLIFDPELADAYAGRITMLDDPRETMGAALKYLGYSLNSTDPDELAEAEDLLADSTARIAAFDSDQFEDLLVTGESAVAHGYSGDFFSAFEEGDSEYEYFVPEEGGTQWVDNMAIVADSDHPCSAHTFIDFLLDAENGAAITNFNFFASPNEAAEEFIDPEVLEDPAIYPDEEVRERLEFIEDTGDYEINFQDAFTRAKG